MKRAKEQLIEEVVRNIIPLSDSMCHLVRLSRFGKLVPPPPQASGRGSQALVARVSGHAEPWDPFC
jgi:hypothetical protein